MTTRRDFIRDASMVGVASIALGAEVSGAIAGSLAVRQRNPQDLAGDEAFWAKVAGQYKTVPGVTNLEGGSFGQMAVPVLEAFHRNADRANNGGSYFARREYGPIYNDVRNRIAAFIGASPSETMIARNASDALQTIIGNYNKVSAGDTVMYADLDFNAMQWAMNELARAAADSSRSSTFLNRRRATTSSQATRRRSTPTHEQNSCSLRTGR